MPVYSRLLPPAEYGILELVTVAGVLLNFVIPLEIGQGLARHFVEARDPQAKSTYATTALAFTLAMYLPFLLAGMALAPQLAQLLLGAPEHAGSVRLGLAAIGATGVFIGIHNQLRWQFTPGPFLAAALVYAATSAGVSLWLLLRGGMGADAVIVGQLAAACAGGLTAGWFARPSFRAGRFSQASLAEMLAYSMPLVISSGSVFLLQFADRFVLREFTDVATVGLYSVGGRLASAANLVLIGVGAALTPLIFEGYARAGTPALLERIFRVFVAAALVTMMAGSLFARELLSLAAGAEYAAAWPVIPFLAFASVVARMYIFAPGPDIAKRTRLIMAINVAGAVAAVTTCYVLVAPLGMVGAAIGMLLGALLAFGLYMFFSQRLYPVPHVWGPIVAATAVTATTIAAVLGAEARGLATGGALLALKAGAGLVAAGVIYALLSPRRRAETVSMG